MMPRRRQTLAGPTEPLEGVGLHTGERGRVQLVPAEREEPGIVFRRPATGAHVRAVADSVTDTRRCTVLGAGGLSVQTVEHLLSACSGMGLTDATVLVEGPEIPILDGSALPFAAAIASAALIEYDGLPDTLVLDVPLALTDGDAAIIAYPSATPSISVIIEYPAHSAIGVQAAVYSGVNYQREVAPARTYGFISELQDLRGRGLALGAGLENAVALLDDGEADPRTPLRFPNELARHKLLDMIGDLSLAGKLLQAGIVAVRPSHALNTRFARLLAGTVTSGQR